MNPVRLIAMVRELMLCATALGLMACAEAGADAAGEDMSSPRLYRVILPVADIERTAGFYGAVLETPGERVSPGRHCFDLGGTIFALYDPAADGDAFGKGWAHHENQYIYIAVCDLDATLQRAKRAGAEIVGDIETMPWRTAVLHPRSVRRACRLC